MSHLEPIDTAFSQTPRTQIKRPPNRQELAGTLVLALPLTEASAKMRSGAPVDDEADYELPVWAGELPLRLTTLEPIADPRLATDVTLPKHVQNYSRQR